MSILMEYRVISLVWLHETEQRHAPGISRSHGQETALNELGREGWQLVSAIYVPDADRAGIGRSLLYFQRPIPEARSN